MRQVKLIDLKIVEWPLWVAGYRQSFFFFLTEVRTFNMFVLLHVHNLPFALIIGSVMALEEGAESNGNLPVSTSETWLDLKIKATPCQWNF